LPTRQSSFSSDSRGEIATTVALEIRQSPGWLGDRGGDPARAAVVAALRALADSGEALWTILESGDVRFSCESGAVYHLTENGVTRIR
jgi:hypothetical protein